MKIPKILIACPTSDVKNYCAEEWIRNLDAIRWPNCSVLIVDNSEASKKNADHLRKLCSENLHHKGFFVLDEGRFGGESVNQVLQRSHDKCAEMMFKGGYDYLFHLESDVFPEKDILEKLVFHKKSVCAGIYYRDEGAGRKVMLQRSYMKTNYTIGSLNYMPDEDIGFLDGTLKQVAHAGLGCCLIHKSVFNKVRFRFDPENPASPDTYFAMDCHSQGIGIFADTSAICEHKNQNWGAYGIDWK